MNRVLVNPPCGANQDIPCVPLGFLSARFEVPVLDFNTSVAGVDTASKIAEAEEALVAVQSRSWSWCERLECEFGNVRSVTTPIKGQCCYNYLRFDDNYHLEHLPAVPRYDLFSSYLTFLDHWKTGRWPYALYTSLGCPYKCIYCDARESGWRARQITDIKHELDHAVALGVKHITILDDCFNLNAEHAILISRLLETYGIQWMCTNGLRADRLTPEVAEAMSGGGCTTAGFGVESSDDGVLAAIQKGETRADLERGLAIARHSFDSVSAYVIAGMPGSTYDRDKRTIDWCIRQGVYVHVSDYVEQEEGALVKDRTFYGGEPSELRDSAVGLSWGSKRSFWDNLFARVSLLFGWGPRVAWRYIRMDTKKAVNRWSR